MSNSLALVIALQPLAQQLGVGREQRSVAIQLYAQLTIAVTLWITLMLGNGVEQQPLSVMMGGFSAPMGINLYLDRLSLLLLVATQLALLLLWPADATPRIHALMLLLSASSMGLALSGDLFNLYVFYELLAVATFGLVAANSSRSAPLISFRYLLISGLGSVLALSGIALIYSHTGSLNLADISATLQHGDAELPLAAFILILLGIGVKAELFAVNGWVPEVYAIISPRLSALLAGVVSKLAVVVIVRVLLMLFPHPEAAQVLLVLGILGVISGELAAWRAQDLRRMLAYSSIGQLGMIFIAFSLSLEFGMLMGLLLSLHHMVVKPGLFMLTAGKSKRWHMALFVLFALSLVGVPPLPGFWVKLSLLTGLVEAGGALNQLALIVFLGATVIEASYLFRVLQNTLPNPPAVDEGHLTVGWNGLVGVLLGGVLVVTTLSVDPVLEQLKQISSQAGDRNLLISSVVTPSAEQQMVVERDK